MHSLHCPIIEARMDLGHRAPASRALVPAAHQEHAEHAALLAGAKRGAQHHQIGGIGHLAVEQIVLLHLQPVAFARLVDAVHVLQHQSFEAHLQHLHREREVWGGKGADHMI